MVYTEALGNTTGFFNKSTTSSTGWVRITDTMKHAHKQSNFSIHTSVLMDEVLDSLVIEVGNWYVDATFGGGGHTAAILDRGGNVIGIDRDKDAVEKGFLFLQESGYDSERFQLLHGAFADLAKLLSSVTHPIAGVLFDIGLSSDQLASDERGFSFQIDAPLDMRMDKNLGVTAADLVNGLSEQELTKLFRSYGEMTGAKRIAKAIINKRSVQQFASTKELADVVESNSPKRWSGIHPATLVFQALRIAVNDELHQLEQGLEAAEHVVERNGRIVVISFHSLEDRIVKNYFNNSDDLEVVTKHPIQASEKELEQNIRARSAKLRVAKKI